MKPKCVEEAAYQAVELGEIEIDGEGRIWRVAVRKGNRWTGGTYTLPCKRRRAENFTGRYLQFQVKIGGKRINAEAHRLVWRHFFGPIPDGMTVNHIDGNPANNRPGNLELATYSDQVLHSILVLGHQRSRDVRGRFAGSL